MEAPMFARIKKSGKYQYLQVVENPKRNGKVRQRVIATSGRIGQLHDKDRVETLIRSLSRFSERALLILSDKSDMSANALKIGPVLIFERLWRQTGIKAAIERLLVEPKFELDVERAVFVTVPHRFIEKMGTGSGNTFFDNRNMPEYKIYRKLSVKRSGREHPTPSRQSGIGCMKKYQYLGQVPLSGIYEKFDRRRYRLFQSGLLLVAASCRSFSRRSPECAPGCFSTICATFPVTWATAKLLPRKFISCGIPGIFLGHP
jgi:hypothetical protein